MSEPVYNPHYYEERNLAPKIPYPDDIGIHYVRGAFQPHHSRGQSYHLIEPSYRYGIPVANRFEVLGN